MTRWFSNDSKNFETCWADSLKLRGEDFWKTEANLLKIPNFFLEIKICGTRSHEKFMSLEL